MKELSILEKKEIRDIKVRTSMVRAMYEPKTIDECRDLYLNATEIANVAAISIKDGLQGKALLEAKKLICNIEWDTPLGKMSKHFSTKWLNFLSTINLTFIDKGKYLREKTNVRELLDFAGYKERGGEIETASHYQEVKKITGATNKEPEKIDEAYRIAGGKELKTAKEVKEKVAEVVEKVNPLKEFFKKYPEYQKEEPTISPIALGQFVLNQIPQITRKEWKKTYRTLAACVHPDKGGSDKDMSTLASINKIMETLFENAEKKAFNEKRKKTYAKFCEENGYKYFGI